MSRPGIETPDELLVIEAVFGDFEAFDELALRYRAAVVRTAQAIVGREDAEDVAQDALLLAFKALPSIEDPTKFAAWLSAITRHRALRFNKRESAYKQGRIELDELLLEQIGALAGPTIDETVVDEEVKHALENIPADYALVLRLRFQDEMPLKRIAAFLGVTLATAKWRVHRGKQLLREQIEIFRTRGETWKEIKSY
jgi:RNA polymerase sigma-70 factor (ECF subfamily)